MLVQGTILRNRYRIIKELGGGGFADTYLAEDSDLPKNSQCVVKHLKPTSTDPAVLPIARRLFKTEAQVLDDLGSHDQIPRLLAHFEENGEFYLVQELVNGHDLSQELTPGRRFSKEEVTKLLQDILEVLVVVHQRNIIHRDIKPQNIMRRRMDEKIVLIDFGAVKEIGSLAVNTQGQVKSTIAIGTPGYMPSEQANRDPKLCSDIYAVGMIGIQALTGLLPQQLLQDPTGEVIWRNYVQVSDDIKEVLSKMVRYHFSQRYQSANEALQAVNALMPQSYTAQSQQLVRPFARLISQVSKPRLRGSLIGLGGLGAGIVATFALINRSQPPNPPVLTPTQSPIATSTTSTPTSSPSQTDAVAQPNINFAIAPRFQDVGNFSDGLASVEIDGKWGYIDKSGNTVIQPQFDKTNKFSEGLALVWIYGQNWDYIDKIGNFVTKRNFIENKAREFSQGLARACIVSTCGYIDKTGSFVIERKFVAASDFFEGLAAIQIGDKRGYIDRSGNVVIQTQFDRVGNFHEGLALVQIGNKWGYIDKSGNIVIQPQFDKAYNFSEELAGVQIDNKWGYIDKTGNRVIQPQFDKAGDFHEGLAVVQIDNKWGYIDKTGNRVIQPQFDKAGNFSEGFAWIQESTSKKYGYIRNPLK
ncbi:WG repeat-containing protein [Nostoc sp. NMS4]|uniref:WG repeat-containing protein n=1 Tax=Nostoc sp. NMS4 TaxID=2815390 RepID=UPI0025E54F3D|nr:WG repeat-containing protein [Nostoc sp. NMS4]MBN3924092.1 WG repeat-containing protein [Nostoc sp. NMS4]